jgi:hypothetical protein
MARRDLLPLSFSFEHTFTNRNAPSVHRAMVSFLQSKGDVSVFGMKAKAVVGTYSKDPSEEVPESRKILSFRVDQDGPNVRVRGRIRPGMAYGDSMGEGFTVTSSRLLDDLWEAVESPRRHAPRQPSRGGATDKAALVEERSRLRFLRAASLLGLVGVAVLTLLILASGTPSGVTPYISIGLLLAAAVALGMASRFHIMLKEVEAELREM